MLPPEIREFWNPKVLSGYFTVLAKAIGSIQFYKCY